MRFLKVCAAFFAFVFTITFNLYAEELIIFHAGSLSSPIRDLAATFQKIHPNIKVHSESAGSRESARKVSELKRKADIVAVADYQVIDDILIPEYTDWYIKFARNKMVIAFTERSKYGDEINSDNWYKILARKDVKFGHSDPNLDPCGYRALMVWQLADLYYKDTVGGKAIYDALSENCPPNNIRPAEIEILPLLQSVALDYVFEYISLAKQHNLKFITLPEEIDLSNPDFEDTYRQAKVMVTGKKPGEMVPVYGTDIVYAVTIPKDAPNCRAAIEFIKFMLSPVGQRIMEDNSQPLLSPPVANDISKLPQEIKLMCK